ncbi:hypothetical protein LCM23_13185 [Cytobacillus kochii]|uniref:hypothetical protein n=1 Tax=Cytobacillus kochii TaxID=859143 RepID=UPI001CD357DE|nr:hypothetical protein [Cytobacillus kochii]MCA1027049.1 hypothetical protein [Cytobacillus kochii]
MTKLEELLNEYFATEGLTLQDHLDAAKGEVNLEDALEEFAKLGYWLKDKVN